MLLKQFVIILTVSGSIFLMILTYTFLSSNIHYGNETAKIELGSIVCGNCVERIKTALKMDEGIINSNISLEKKEVLVKFNKTKTNLENIESLIIQAGYDANDRIADSNAYRNLSECCKIWGDGENYMEIRVKESNNCSGGCCAE